MRLPETNGNPQVLNSTHPIYELKFLVYIWVDYKVLEALFSVGFETVLQPRAISFSFQIRPSISLTGMGHHTGTSGYNRLTRLRMAANRFREIDTSATWKQV